MSKASKFLGNRLRMLRKESELTQEQAAYVIGRSFKYYQELEGGKIEGVRLNTIEAAASAYGLTISEFFDSKCPVKVLPKRKPSPHRRPSK